MRRTGAPWLALGIAVLLLGALPARAPSDGRTDASRSISWALATDAVSLPAGVPVTPVGGTSEVTLTFTLADPNAPALASLLARVEDPGSPDYRHFLTSAQFDARFAPSPGTVGIAERALRSAGAVQVEASPDDLAVSAVLPVGAAEALLGVRFVTYGPPGGDAELTVVGTPRLAGPLAALVTGIDGLSGSAAPPATGDLEVSSAQPLAPSAFVVDNATGDQWFVGSDFAQAYGATALWPGSLSVANATYPTSVAVATLLASGYNLSLSTTLPAFDPRVVDQYFTDTLGPTWPVPNVTGVPVAIPGGAGLPPAPGPFQNLTDSTLDSVENALDLEMAGSLAPGAPLYNFYFNGSVLADPALPIGDVADDFAADLAAALNYSYAPASLGVVSCSFGLPDLNDSYWDAELLKAAATGVTVVSASGDQGDAPDALTGRGDGAWPIWPATATFNTSGALAVGGVSVALDGEPGSYYAGPPLTATYDAESDGLRNVTAWYDDPGAGAPISGTEGGVSSVYAEPWWQFHSAAQPEIVNESILQDASTLGRAEPDLAFPANATIAYVYENGTGTLFFALIEGTSVAAPIAAGLLADVVAVESARAGRFSPLGFVDPALYRIASYFASLSGPPSPADPWLPVTSGSNFVFEAAPGWNALAGWGGLDAPLFLAADENGSIVNYTYVGPTPSLPPRNAPTPAPPALDYLLLGAGVLAAAVVLLLVARVSPRTRPPPPPYAPAGPAGAGPPLPARAPAYAGPTFLCPYCGTVRPAEPIRCPGCGAF